MSRHRGAAGALVAGVALATSLLAGCGGSGGSVGGQQAGSGGGKELTVWTEENDPQRMTAQRQDIAKFTASTGIHVKLVGIAENQFSTLITSAAAAGRLPDVIGALPVSDADQLATEKIADTAAANAVVAKLGRSTFQAKALQLATQHNSLVGVPSDSWVQLLVYRKDLFTKYHLPAPTTYATIQSDAAALKKHGYIGIVAATDANDAFTEQTFEYIALANGCQLVSSTAKVTLDSPACQQAFSFYDHLIKNDSVQGSQTVDTTSQEYLAGKAGMIIYSSYILPPLAGQEQGSVSSCPQCKSDPSYLASNSGVVTSISGGGGHVPTDYGQLATWVITNNTGHRSTAEQFVSYMMSKGYASWLGLDPPGKLPVRTTAGSGPISAQWSKLPISLGGSKQVSAFYAPNTLTNLLAGPSKITEWGLPDGQGALLGATLASEPVPAAVSSMIGSGLSPSSAASQATAAVKSLQGNL